MKLKGLPTTFSEWEIMRKDHLEQNLHHGVFTIDLFDQYKKLLGNFRYKLLLQGQILVVPPIVNQLLNLGKFSWMHFILPPYQLARKIKLDWALKSIILPGKYKAQIRELDTSHS
jgi:hypothetical protein